MCERLPHIRAALGRFAAQFDPAVIDAREAVLVVRAAAAIEASAAAVKALAAARAAEGGAWRGVGARSPADGLAADLGVGSPAARQLLTTGRRLTEQPELQAAAKAGSLSAKKVALVANAAEADPGAERRLIELAEESTLA